MKSRAWRLGGGGALGALLLGIAVSVAQAAPTREARSPIVEVTSTNDAASAWRASGGELGFRFNLDLLRHIGLGVEIGKDARRDGEYVVFALADAESLEFDAPHGHFQRFRGGAVRAAGRLVLRSGDERIELRGFRLRPRGANALDLELVDGAGRAWFDIDHLMQTVDDDARLRVPTMDLRIGAALARRLGKPSLAGLYIADLRLVANLIPGAKTVAVPDSCASPNWPGSAGNGYQADVLLEAMSMQMMRCRQASNPTASCDGPGTDDGEVVFAPNSTLRNGNDNNANGAQGACTAGNPCTADVPWHTKFSGTFPPYNNDQHPYLIWNLYRIDASGRLEQIGRSGVKHAFLTTNIGCAEVCGDNQILGRGCGDTYSTGNNDNNNSLGPRSEIVPASGEWGRCGSIYDPDCNGQQNPGGNDNWSQRLIVRESQIDPAANPGARYFAESWYVIRDDVDIENTMGYLGVTPRYALVWQLPSSAGLNPGPVINAWVDPQNPGPNASNNVLQTVEGRTRVAAKVTALGGGSYRYDFAVMNLDFARALTESSGSKLRVLANRGFDSFRVAVDAASVSAISFSDGDGNAANDWTGTLAGGALTWTAPGAATLDWGTLYSFSFVADAAPQVGYVSLGVAEAGRPAEYHVAGFSAGPPPAIAKQRRAAP